MQTRRNLSKARKIKHRNYLDSLKRTAFMRESQINPLRQFKRKSEPPKHRSYKTNRGSKGKYLQIEIRLTVMF